MRLWHQDLIEYLPRKQLLGQHRECCALRGKGWGKRHSVVNYVFEHSYIDLYCYHIQIMNEMTKRNYNVSEEWRNPYYRGKLLGYNSLPNYTDKIENIFDIIKDKLFSVKIYTEHNYDYLLECIENLKGKDIDLALPSDFFKRQLIKLAFSI